MNSEIDWLRICRRCVSAQAAVFAQHRGSLARSNYDGVGEGGDHALVIDRLCEDVVFTELEALGRDGHSLTAISEERGTVTIGPDSAAGGDVVVIDPIDGSLNARRTLPSHSFSFAVADGHSMADVRFGFVHDFGADDEFAAVRGQGATLNGDPFAAATPAGGLEVVGIESAEPGWIMPILAELEGDCYRIRAIGSIAITLSYVAAARLDGMITARPCRSVDAAAAALIAREAGAIVAFEGLGLSEAELSLDARYRLIGARDADGAAVLTRILAQCPPPRR